MLYASADGGIQIVYLIQTGFKLQGQWWKTIIWQLMQSSLQEKRKKENIPEYIKSTEKVLEGKISMDNLVLKFLLKATNFVT